MSKNTTQLGQLITEKISKKGLIIRLPTDYWGANKMYVFAVPNLNNNSSSEKDIIISRLNPGTWKNIYSIRIVPKQKHDEKGFIAGFTKLLNDRNVNILRLQSNPTFYEEPYSFWLLLDLTECVFLKDIESKIKVFIQSNIEEIDDKYFFYKRSELVKDFMSKILSEFAETTEVRGVEFLYNFVMEFNKNDSNEWRKQAQNKDQSFEIKNNKGYLPKYILDLCGIKRKKIQYSIVSNPNQKSFFIMRIFDKSSLLYFDIKNKDQIGDSFNLTNIISSNKGNILTATIYIEILKAKAHLYTLVEINSDKTEELLIDLNKCKEVTEVELFNYSFNQGGVDFYNIERKYSKIKIHHQQGALSYFQYVKRVILNQDYEGLLVALKQIGIGLITNLLAFIIGGILGRYTNNFDVLFQKIKLFFNNL